MVGLSHLRFAAGVCVLAAGLLMGGAGGAVAVADPGSSGSAAHGDGGTNASGQQHSTNAEKPKPGGTDSKDGTLGSGGPSTGAEKPKKPKEPGATTQQEPAPPQRDHRRHPQREPAPRSGNRRHAARAGTSQQSATDTTTSATRHRPHRQPTPPHRQPAPPHRRPTPPHRRPTPPHRHRHHVGAAPPTSATGADHRSAAAPAHHMRRRRRHHIGSRRPPHREPAPPRCGNRRRHQLEPARPPRFPMWSAPVSDVIASIQDMLTRLPVRSSRSRNCSPTFTPSCWASPGRRFPIWSRSF